MQQPFPRWKNPSLVRHVVCMPIKDCPKRGSSYNCMTSRLTQTRVPVVLRCMTDNCELCIAIECSQTLTYNFHPNKRANVYTLKSHNVSTRSISVELSVNIKFDMISELHHGLIVHVRSENYNLRSRVVLHTTLTTASIACNRIDRLRCHQRLSILRKWKRGISGGVVICLGTST